MMHGQVYQVMSQSPYCSSIDSQESDYKVTQRREKNRLASQRSRARAVKNLNLLQDHSKNCQKNAKKLKNHIFHLSHSIKNIRIRLMEANMLHLVQDEEYFDLKKLSEVNIGVKRLMRKFEPITIEKMQVGRKPKGSVDLDSEPSSVMPTSKVVKTKQVTYKVQQIQQSYPQAKMMAQNQTFQAHTQEAKFHAYQGPMPTSGPQSSNMTSQDSIEDMCQYFENFPQFSPYECQMSGGFEPIANYDMQNSMPYDNNGQASYFYPGSEMYQPNFRQCINDYSADYYQNMNGWQNNMTTLGYNAKND